jgi:hypothetical protein
MPKVISKHVAIRKVLGEIVRETVDLDERLEEIIAIKSKGSSEIFHGKVDHSQPPWNAPVAGLILELHAWARATERAWRLTAGLTAWKRGGSRVNTVKALESLCGLSEPLDDTLVHESRAWLTGWCKRASIVLGEAESAKRLPRVHGEKESRCPWCKHDTLRQMALAGVIFCIDPKCMDEDGHSPRAQLEYFRGEMVLRWQDGIIGSP